MARLEELLIEVLPADPHIVPIAHFYGSPTPGDSVLDDPVNRYVVTDGEDRAMEGPGSVIRALVRFLGDLRLDLQDLGPETVVSAAHAPGCAARLDDVIATRVVELVLHGDDIDCSVEVEWDPPPTAARVVLHALIEVARGRSGDVAVLRALGRLERAEPGTFPVL